MSTTSLSFLGAEQPTAANEMLGIVNVTGEPIFVSGCDPLAPAGANQRDADFDTRVIDGPRAFIKTNFKRIVETWVNRRESLFRTLEVPLAVRLHRRTKELMKLGNATKQHEIQACFRAAWKEIFGEDAPTAAVRYDHQRAVDGHRAWFKRNGLPFDDRWPIEKMREYRARPELIASDRASGALADEQGRMAREEADAEVAATFRVPRTGAPMKPTADAADDFLGTEPVSAAPAMTAPDLLGDDGS